MSTIGRTRAGGGTNMALRENPRPEPKLLVPSLSRISVGVRLCLPMLGGRVYRHWRDSVSNQNVRRSLIAVVSEFLLLTTGWVFPSNAQDNRANLTVDDEQAISDDRGVSGRVVGQQCPRRPQDLQR